MKFKVLLHLVLNNEVCWQCCSLKYSCSQSPKMVEVLLKLEKEINEGGLTIRGDRKLDADLG